MNPAIALVAGVALLVSPVALATNPELISTGKSSCNVAGQDSQIRSHDNALVFKRDRKIVVEIHTDYSLHVDGQPVLLTPEQQFAVATYRGGYDALILEAKELGLAGASLGTQAVFGIIGALLRGSMSEYSAEIEAHAATLEDRAMTVCALAESLQDQHAELVTSIPAFGRALSN